MTTPTLLRVYRGEPEGAEHGDDGRRDLSLHSPFYAVAFSAAIHILVLGVSSLLAAVGAFRGGAPLTAVPQHLLHLVFVAFVLAQCGLAAIVFARSSWPLFAKALAVAILVGGLWLLLIASLQQTRDGLLAASAWATSLGLQVAVVVTIATLVELTIQYEPAAARSRFGLVHLLAATTAIAITLGLTKNFAAGQGFVLADVPRWPFFPQVQLAGCLSAIFTVALYGSLRLANTWFVRAIACVLVLTGMTLLAPLAFQSVFGNYAGASLIEMRWFFGSEGLFLVGTLVPLQILGSNSYISK